MLRWVVASPAADPRDPRAAAIAAWLLHSRAGDRWVSTRDTGIALLALTGYLARLDEPNPDYTVRPRVNGVEVAEHTFTRDPATWGEVEFEAPTSALHHGVNKISFARSRGQIENALLAARALDGTVAPPGGEFSFNRCVGPWTADRGYRRAPVSYDGELTPATGGGVCQLSSTLYVAALLAGMEVLERNRHFWPVSYALPGLDAAVAYPSIDLRFRNPLPAYVALRARGRRDQLIVELVSTASGRARLKTLDAYLGAQLVLPSPAQADRAARENAGELENPAKGTR